MSFRFRDYRKVGGWLGGGVSLKEKGTKRGLGAGKGGFADGVMKKGSNGLRKHVISSKGPSANFESRRKKSQLKNPREGEKEKKARHMSSPETCTEKREGTLSTESAVGKLAGRENYGKEPARTDAAQCVAHTLNLSMD